MKIKSIIVSIFLFNLIFNPFLYVYSEANNTSAEHNSIDIQDAQDTKEIPNNASVEVQIKDNKTQETSTLIINPNERVLREIQDIKISLQQLQQTLDYLVNHVIADLEAENQQLKATLQNYGLNPLPQNIPRNPSAKYVPGGPTTSEEITPNLPTPNNIPSKPEQPPETPQEFSFRILEEWGRDPEVVKQMNTKAPTIKGIIGVVPYGSPREKLQELARELRMKYDAYDNINIEVFDDETYAREYIEKNIKNQEHNVLSISKHKESGRDIITIYGMNEPLVSNLTNNP